MALSAGNVDIENVGVSADVLSQLFVVIAEVQGICVIIALYLFVSVMMNRDGSDIIYGCFIGFIVTTVISMVTIAIIDVNWRVYHNNTCIKLKVARFNPDTGKFEYIEHANP